MSKIALEIKPIGNLFMVDWEGRGDDIDEITKYIEGDWEGHTVARTPFGMISVYCLEFADKGPENCYLTLRGGLTKFHGNLLIVGVDQEGYFRGLEQEEIQAFKVTYQHGKAVIIYERIPEPRH